MNTTPLTNEIFYAAISTNMSKIIEYIEKGIEIPTNEAMHILSSITMKTILRNNIKPNIETPYYQTCLISGMELLVELEKKGKNINAYELMKILNDTLTAYSSSNTNLDTTIATDIKEESINIEPNTLDFDFEDLNEVISEEISNITGFCHLGFDWSIVVNAKLDISE